MPTYFRTVALLAHHGTAVHPGPIAAQLIAVGVPPGPAGALAVVILIGLVLFAGWALLTR